MVISMTYRIPLMHGLIDEQTIREIMSSPTFEKESFDREYGSKWSGAMKGAAFNRNTVMKTRKIVRAEHYYKLPEDTHDFYIVSADMAKDGSANTAVVIIKATPRDFNFLYQVVNNYTIDTTDYKIVSDELKIAVKKYKAEYLVYDASGIGAAIRDWLNKDSVTDDGQILNGLGIINPPKDSEKDVIKYSKGDTICYEVKSAGIASDINTLFFGRLKSGAVKMLIPFQEALNKFKETKTFNESSLNKQKKMLLPYQFADKMQEELLNLDVMDVSDNGRRSLKVKRRNENIQKDFFSALSYGIYVIHTERELKYYKKNKRSKVKASSYIFYSGND